MNTKIFSNNLNKIIITLIAVGYAFIATGSLVFVIDKGFAVLIYASILVFVTALILDFINDKFKKEDEIYGKK